MHKYTKLFNHWSIITNLTAKEIKVRYMGAALGLLWSLGNPLIMILTYVVVLTWIFPSNQDRFILNLVTGILHWSFFSQIISQGCDWLTSNANLIRKVRFPRLLLPIAGFLTICTFWLSAFLIYILLYKFLQGSPSIAFLMYPLVLIFYMSFSFGIGLILSIINVLFRDTKYITEVFLPLLLWLSPIMWTIDQLPPNATFIAHINPLSIYFSSFRKIFVLGQFPSSSELALMGGLGLASVIAGLLIFTFKADQLVESL